MSFYEYVNTKMGTANSRRYSNGNCYPVCAVPHGMNFFTLQTGGSGGWFYSPYDSSFEGIRLTHLPSPWLSDYGQFLIWCESGEDSSMPYWSSFDRKKAVIEPSYISVGLQRGNCSIQLAPTNSSAILRFKFGYDYGNKVVFSARDVEYNYNLESKILFMKTFHKNTEGVKLFEYLAICSDADYTVSSDGDKVILSVEAASAEIRLSTSYISFDQALLNMKRELGDKSLETVYAEAKALWEDCLSKIRINDPDEEAKATFYSCLYRFNLWPRRFYELDEDGRAIHVNTATGERASGVLYTDNGFWDTFRTVYPLYSLLDRELYSEMAEGFYNYYVDTGWLPKWVCPHNVSCMPGMLVEATLSDAVVKDVVSETLAEKILEAMLKDGECDSGKAGVGRINLSDYRKYGYLPYTTTRESVNETLDNAFGDYAIAKTAEKLGRFDIAQKYFDYSKNYRHLFDKESGFMRGRDENGRFREEDFDPFAWGRDYTEGSAWQNSFGVYHDIDGLNELYEGRLSEKIDELMTAPPTYRMGGYGQVIHEMAELAMGDYGQCAISNQPSFHIPYIYSALGEPEKTSRHTHALLRKFDSSEEGYPGDDDNGTMSAWYILSAMGLYQIAPSDTTYLTSLPFFEEMTVKLSGGKELYIKKEDYDLRKMSGKTDYFDIMRGGNLSETIKNKN